MRPDLRVRPEHGAGLQQRLGRLLARALRPASWLALAGLIFALLAATAPAAIARDWNEANAWHESARVGVVAVADLPPEAVQTLASIRRGGPFAYPRKDGSVFGNFEKRLPPEPRGYYREYTVPTPGAHDRGARRIIAGAGSVGDVARSGEYYYSDDHYRSFSRIRP